ncbi:hypothetical protein BDR05DRAFT_1002295 [Suillus weaverae]|nr:hypothetical protein BDR05DRAFT_1002295 [Suillus weaverae]
MTAHATTSSLLVLAGVGAFNWHKCTGTRRLPFGDKEKLRWASNRDTTKEEDIAYSLFGIFDVNLPVIYGDKRQKALERLLQEIMAPDNTFYKAPPCLPPSLFKDEMQRSVSVLQNIVTVESTSSLYTLLENISVPRFVTARLRLPCIAFSLTEIKRMPEQDGDNSFAYDVKADESQDLLITTEDKLAQFSPARPAWQAILLIRPWNRYDLELPDFADKSQGADDWPNESESLSCKDTISSTPGPALHSETPRSSA